MRGVRRGAAALLVTTVATTATLVGGAAIGPAGALPPECDRTWLGGSGSWTDTSQWSGGVLPTATDDVCITDGIGTVELRATEVTVNTLQLGSRTDDGTRTLALVPNAAGQTAALTATAGIDIQYGGVLVLGGLSTTGTPGGTARVAVGEGAEIANGGTITSAHGSGGHTAEILGHVENPARLRVRYPLHIDDLRTTGFIEMAATLTLDHFEGYSGHAYGYGAIESPDMELGDLQSGLEDHDGWPVFRVTDGALAVTADEGTGHIELRGDVDLTGPILEGHQVWLKTDDGPTTVSFSGTLVNAGTITFESAAERTARLVGVGPDAVVQNDGMLSMQAGTGAGAVIEADVVNHDWVHLGQGELYVVGDLANDGFLDLRTSRVGVEGDLELGATGVLAHSIEVGEGNGHLEAIGDATVDGDLLTRTIDEPPAVGTLYGLVSAASRTGSIREHVFEGDASYDLIPTSIGLELERRASEAPAYRFVRAAFQDFLGRQPTLDPELTEIGAALQDGTTTRASVVRELSMSDEYITALVQDLYLDTLGRNGDEAGVDFWVGQLRTGRKTVAQVAGAFYGSEEYIEQVGGTPAAWISSLFPVLLGREATSQDRSYWAERAVALGPTRVAIELFQSLESRRARVDRLYLALLGREGDPGGIAYWAGRLTREGDLALAVSLASSGEYLELAQVRYP